MTKSTFQTWETNYADVVPRKNHGIYQAYNGVVKCLHSFYIDKYPHPDVAANYAYLIKIGKIKREEKVVFSIDMTNYGDNHRVGLQVIGKATNGMELVVFHVATPKSICEPDAIPERKPIKPKVTATRAKNNKLRLIAK